MQNVKLNLIPGSVMPVVNVSQYDKARQFSITVYEGASTYSLTGKSVQIRGTKPDGNGFAYDSTDGVVSVSGSTVTISTTQQMTAVGGQTMAELRITQSGVVLGTLNFIIMVEPSALSDDTPISDTDIPAIERLAEAQVEQAEAWAKGTKSGVPVSSDEPQYHNNSYYWSEVARQYAEGGLQFKGSVAFASIPTTGMVNGDMYNITDDFTTDSRFIEGAGVKVNAGTNIAWLANSIDKWDVLATGDGPDDLGDLDDVTITTPTDGQALIYDNNSSKWVNGTVSTVGDLDDLTDVDITSPASGQVLEYDGSKWANTNLPTVPSDLDDLSDVTLSSPSSGQFLKYDGSKWINGSGGGGGASALDDLTDVDITTPSSGQVLKYDGAKWINGTGGGGASDLDDLGDVTITSPTDGQVLTYDAISQKWINAAGGGGPTERVYGASWDGSANTAWTRTDDAATFSDPTPQYSDGNGGWTTGSSPFDTIQPWAGMVRSTDVNAGEIVAIPKYYYKMGYASGTAGLKIQIAPASNGADWATANGYKVSPAHMDRGDGAGERDIVYIGRYHCTSDYTSKTVAAPKVSLTRSTARGGISALGSTIWQSDFALWWTIRMLYLVEFADWNSQAKIGGGCAPDGQTSFVHDNGATDSMTYHTGTTATSISATVYGNTQYRYIEGLYDNCFDFVDGFYCSGANCYGILNPANFSDTTGGTQFTTRVTQSNDYITAWQIPSVTDFEWGTYPSALGGSATTYTPDSCNYNAAGVVLITGGSYAQNQNFGLFYVSTGGSIGAGLNNAQIGCRLMVLPNA